MLKRGVPLILFNKGKPRIKSSELAQSLEDGVYYVFEVLEKFSLIQIDKTGEDKYHGIAMHPLVRNILCEEVVEAKIIGRILENVRRICSGANSRLGRGFDAPLEILFQNVLLLHECAEMATYHKVSFNDDV